MNKFIFNLFRVWNSVSQKQQNLTQTKKIVMCTVPEMLRKLPTGHNMMVTTKYELSKHSWVHLGCNLHIGCLQSPIFLCVVTIACFDQTAAILVCNGEHNLGRTPKLPRGAGVGKKGGYPSPHCTI